MSPHPAAHQSFSIYRSVSWASLLFFQSESPGIRLALHLQCTYKSYCAAGGQKDTCCLASKLAYWQIVKVNVHQQSVLAPSEFLEIAGQGPKCGGWQRGCHRCFQLDIKLLSNFSFKFSLLCRWWRRYDLPERPWGGRRGSLESKPWVQLPCSQLWQQCLLPVAQVGYEGWQRLLLLKLNLVLSVKRLAVPGRPLMTTPSLWISSLPQIFLSNTIPKRMYWA